MIRQSMHRLLLLATVLLTQSAFGVTFTKLAVTAMGASQVTITFTTSGSVTTQVNYGIGNVVNSTIPDSAGTTHSFTITGLAPGNVYSYQAAASDSTSSGVQQFQLCDGGTNMVSVQGKVNNYYMYGTWSAVWTDGSGTGQSPTLCGVSLTQNVTGALDYLGSMTATLGDNLKIVPSPSTWLMTATDVGRIAPDVTPATVTGQSVDVSGLWQAGALGILQFVWYNPSTQSFYPPTVGTGGVTPSPQYEIPYYNTAGTAAQVAGSQVTVDSATQSQVNAPGGVTTGSTPPTNCQNISGAWCAAQTSTYPNPTTGINDLVADAVNGGWLQILGTGSAVPVANAYTAPLTISASGTVSEPIVGSSSDNVQMTHGSTTNGHCANFSSSGSLVDSGTACVAPTGLNSFVDFSVPSGTINGSNLNFTLGSVPNPASSLILMHNGLVLIQNTDYTLSSSTITFSSTATTPQTGDVLTASYRTATATNFSDFEVPSGTINGSNLTFTVAHTPNPGSSMTVMVDGLVLIQNTDYTLSSTTISFASTATTPKTGDSLVVNYRY